MQRDQHLTTERSLATLPPPRTSRILLRPRRSGEPKPYATKVDQPLMQLGLRVGLWAALAVGCVGGIVAIVRPADGTPEVVDDGASIDISDVPGPVANVAEDTVERWLTATGDEQEALADLFVEPPAAQGAAEAGFGEGIAVGQVSAISGKQLHEGYWSVTVAAELPVGEGAAATTVPEGDAMDGTSAPEGPTTWYVEIGIVGDGDSGYLALTAPAVVPAPERRDADWAVAGERTEVQADDPLATLVETFLTAVLAGGGDSAPYLAPGAAVTAPDPAPFTSVALAEIATEDAGDGRTWVLAHIVATTATGATLPLTYDLTLVDRGDRWEVESLSGIPTSIR